MASNFSSSYTCFDGNRRLATDSLSCIALLVKKATKDSPNGPILIFDDATGRSIDIDTRGTDEQIRSRFSTAGRSETPAPPARRSPRPGSKSTSDEPRGRGRPKLGVVAREVTLLPRHWDWLATQPGGASVALRKLVEDARRNRGEDDKTRASIERAYHFMSAMAGDFPGFEEATRALFARDASRFRELIASWPADVRDHIYKLADRDRVV